MDPIDEVRRFLAELIGPSDTPIARRVEQAKAFAEATPLPDGVTVAAAERGGVPVEWVIPSAADAMPIFLHLHGGGYVMGDPAGSRAFTTEFALRSGARVASVDYRLAPTHPFPAAVDDALTVYRSLIEVGVPARALAVGGESAGGGLAIALLLAIRAAGLPMPACAVAMSPWTNLLCEGDTYVSQAARDPLLTRGILKEMAATYLAGADPRAPLASPGLADLTGLPPLLIQAGAAEVLLSDAEGLAQRAREAGVAANLEVWDDMIHVWHMFHAMLPQGAQAIDRVADFVLSQWSTADLRPG
jgi:monoterpene epsilon-lactone hydrolase